MLYQPDRRVAPYLIVLSVFLFFVGVVVALLTKNNQVINVTSFEECVEAGFPVMESHPRQCRANGELFVEEIPEVTPSPISTSPTPELIACTLDALICPDGTAVGRIPPTCEFETCPNGQ